MCKKAALLAIALLIQLSAGSGLVWADQTVPVGFFGSDGRTIVGPGPFDPSVPTPAAVLGFRLAERPAHSAQVLEYFNALAASSERIKIVQMGQTYEGRPLIYAAVSSADNMRRLDQIKVNLARIADPRRLAAGDLQELVDTTPASVWLAYSIHGDEISGVDAALAVAYRLVAGIDTLTERLLSELVVVIDPNENPDGRERYLAQMEAFATAVPFADGQSLQKGGFWPWGRGNHYLFDMNRDWFTLELVESRARIAAVVEWNPQVLVDAHEMGQWDTYLFSPPRAPFNLQITDRIREWWDIFAADQAAAFDQHGWAYYTREWNEEWYPGYGSSWPLFAGAVGILYEQAGVSGSRMSRHDGTVLTYAESVAHQYVSSLANLTTSANQRSQLLRDYYNHRSRALKEFGGGKAKTYLVAPDRNPDRLNHLGEVLSLQGIEVDVAAQDFTARARGYYEKESKSRKLPAGTLIIPANQPQGFLVQTILGFDPRVPDSFLTIERRELLKHRDSKLYEVTSWTMLQAYGVDAYESDAEVSVSSGPWQAVVSTGRVEGTDPQQGYIFEANADRGLRAMTRLFERDLVMYAAKKELDIEGRSLARGSIFLPARANPVNYGAILDTVARETGIIVWAINSGIGKVGPDLGGGELELLRKPKVAIVADEPTNFTSLAAVWHLLDQKLGLPASMISAARLARVDLSIYNVLVLPDSWGSFADVLGGSAIERLRQWIAGGGTLIAMDGSATFCADTSVNLSSVRMRRQVLDKLADYEEAAQAEIAAEAPDISGLQIWDYRAADSSAEETKKKPTPGLEELKKSDELARIFSPHGAILRVDLDLEHWLSFGMSERVPVMFYGTHALVARFPSVRTVGRFAAPEDVRVSGLLWPEARLRLAHSAYCTREPRGRGQVILFADEPNFRAYFRGSERLLSNAILFGPGLGTYWTPDW